MLGLWLHNLTSTKVNSLTANPHFLSKRKFKAQKKWLYIYIYAKYCTRLVMWNTVSIKLYIY